MKSSFVLPLLSLVFLAQLAIPSSMIIKHERVVREGKEIKFQTYPVDPYDPFLGRYVQIGYEETTAPLPPTAGNSWKQKMYAVLDTDANGFVVVKSLSKTVPQEKTYLAVNISPQKDNLCSVYWPQNRYYMSEKAAPQAEVVYRNRNRESKAYVKMRVLDGIGVITGLYIDNKPIEDCINEHVKAP